ncbi:DUF2800 domain-containing protein [uncultured Megasphaera sp.]|uniref:DUF2800 domain-containing protein n=1 Tax=uncultured Megasphaera sp. TaxID=165188 RepID=UPI0025957B6D|nr:DUF2800 domain-containing protein [uncultured Megasphaera sp.]
MSDHALLSPSSAHRWLQCTPSAVLEESFANQSSSAAEEGTAAHALCEYKIKKAIGERCTKPVSEADTVEMQECSDAYAEFVLERYEQAKGRCRDPLLLIEQKVDFSAYVKDGFGTADCIIVSDNTLQIIDFKYGQGVLVDAYENPQMKCYALGALEMYNALYDIKEVVMTIFQPRRDNVSGYTLSVAELLTWAERVLKPKAEQAIRGKGEFAAGDWCRFCRAKAVCRKRAEENMRLAELEFKPPSLLTDREIEDVLKTLPMLTKWAEDVFSYAAEAAIHHGKEWRGFKVVEGRSIRKYKDETAVIAQAQSHGYTDIFQTRLISMTAMQKLMGKKKFEEILGGLISKSPGKLTLVPETDKRIQVNRLSVNNEFKQEEI